MRKLTDTQVTLLSAAAQRAEGSLLPPPDTVGSGTTRIRKSVETLIKRALASEIKVAALEQAWRTDNDVHWGAIITATGRVAIGAEPEQGPAARPSVAEPRQTKSALVVMLLRRPQGATLAELVQATGWLPHTTRAALMGLRKKGHRIAKGKRSDVTCYTMQSVG